MVLLLLLLQFIFCYRCIADIANKTVNYGFKETDDSNLLTGSSSIPQQNNSLHNLSNPAQIDASRSDSLLSNQNLSSAVNNVNFLRTPQQRSSLHNLSTPTQINRPDSFLTNQNLTPLFSNPEQPKMLCDCGVEGLM